MDQKQNVYDGLNTLLPSAERAYYVQLENDDEQPPDVYDRVDLWQSNWMITKTYGYVMELQLVIK